jgi:hypothetical protein
MPATGPVSKSYKVVNSQQARDLRRIKRNIHGTIKNFSSCKTCMISVKRFQLGSVGIAVA